MKKHSRLFKFYFPTVLKHKIGICLKLFGRLFKVINSLIFNTALTVLYYYYTLAKETNTSIFKAISESTRASI